MKNFDTRTYNISDIIEWENGGLLELSPEFQRRSVWTEKGKSYLIDTIVRGKPIPKILIKQEFRGKRALRIVIDGQQRLRSILEFYRGDFKLSRVHNKEHGGKTFEELPEDLQSEFLKYELGVDVLFEIKYEEILDIFARINSYTVQLSNQELYNAKYLGYFKTYVFNWGLKYVSFLTEANVLSKKNVARMKEAELTADLFIAILDGIKSNKEIKRYYQKYEEEEGDLKNVAKKFDKTMSYIGEIYKPEELSNTNWNRPHLFYTFFVSVAHFLFGVNGLDENLKLKVSARNIGKLRVQLDQISAKIDEVSKDPDNESYPKDYKTFLDYSRRGTNNAKQRSYRSNFLCEKILEGID
ncbi:MAG: DUF262 domain-containing protein [Flavobacteriales bacterium]